MTTTFTGSLKQNIVVEVSVGLPANFISTKRIFKYQMKKNLGTLGKSIR